jgi:hypothetical protein
VLVSVVVASGGCEALVSNEVPVYTCTPDSLTNCPQGEYCKGAGCVPCEKIDPCDGYDNDCDGVIDDGPLSDSDKDGYPVCGHIDPTTGEFVDKDCDDTDPNVHPNAPEVCNGKDNDCDGDMQTEGCANGQQCLQRDSGWQCVNPSDLCTATSCKTPQICDPGTRQCVNAPTAHVGDGCVANSECDSDVCGTDSIVTSQVAHGAGVCTQPCCTSQDCPNGFVCFSPGTGGNYCVAPALIGRTASLGGAQGGGSCASGSDCRSGLCSDTHRCIDACCSDSQCGGGTACALTSVSGHEAFACTDSTGTHNQSQTCNNNPDCNDGLCLNYGASQRCASHCCGSAACGSIDFGNNQVFSALCGEINRLAAPALGNDRVPVCAAFSNPSGTRALGDPCTQGSECRSGRCSPSLGRCYDTCCTYAYCAAVSGWACRPYAPASYALRCVPN